MSKGKLTIVRGVPGSGKSYWAKAQVALDPTKTVRVNKDDLRGMAHDGTFVPPNKGTQSGGTEDAINLMRNVIISGLLISGWNVITDDTNLPDQTVKVLKNIAAKAGAEVEIHDMTDVDLNLCLTRNRQRTGRARVPDEVIMNMHNKYIKGAS